MHENLRYSNLKPNELDGNVFGYHLKRLIVDKYVTQESDGLYSLTAKGRDFIVHRYEDPTRSAHSIYLIIVKNNTSYLLRERKIQPLLGYAGFIHGEPNPGMSVIESAQKRLYNKTGLQMALEIRGSALITQFKNSELQSYSHAIILYGETEQEEISESDETGQNSWNNLEDNTNLLPSCHDIVTMIDEHKTWLERSYHL